MSEELKQLESILDDVCGAGGIMPVDEPVYTISLTEIAEAFRRLKSGQGEAVAWECTAVRGGVSMQRSTWKSEEDADGWIEHYKARDCQTTKTPLYTAPPASADVVSVPRELLKELIDAAEYGTGINNHELIQARALLAQSESKG